MQQKPLQRFKNIFKYHRGSGWSWEDFADKSPPLQSCEGPSAHVPMMPAGESGRWLHSQEQGCHKESCGHWGVLAPCLKLRSATASTCLPGICLSDGCHLRSGVMLSENLLPAWLRPTTKLTARERRNTCCEHCWALCLSLSCPQSHGEYLLSCETVLGRNTGLWDWLCSFQGTLPHEGTRLLGLAKYKSIMQQWDSHFYPRSGGWGRIRARWKWRVRTTPEILMIRHRSAEVEQCVHVLICPF